MACRVGDCFNNVQKKYLKINRALFNELKYRIKDQDWTGDRGCSHSTGVCVYTP